ncbi:uncharacterized protein C8orf58 homolog isoform X2 [Onychomys torridus]|uniref:uncharacterized protein C8orf58 homolog isoform X2 n=1 Tax=Onychomys torridus TaxID=38674 RepID=UPI00167F8070|nr:uncharacterized protein C8orf58 homolog isoform X2 [Onychomys torridus]
MSPGTEADGVSALHLHAALRPGPPPRGVSRGLAQLGGEPRAETLRLYWGLGDARDCLDAAAVATSSRERAMLSRRRVFAVERLGSRDGAFEDLAQGCVVPGVTCTYRRIPDQTHGCSWDFGEGQMPLLKLASQDSGMEMVVGDSPLATLSGLSQDSLNLEPMGSPELPSAQLDRLLARQKLEQVLERSREFPSLSGRHSSLQLLSKPVGGVPIFAGELESTEADAELDAGLEEPKVVGHMESGALTCLPGQGLRYLEHLCLVLEQMARLQQLYLQLQTQRPCRDPEEEALALSSSHTLDNRVEGHREQLRWTRDAGVEAASLPEVGVLTANPRRLPEALLESTHILPSSQGHKDLSHWDRVKVLLNRIRWRSPRLPEPPAPPDGSGPRMAFRNLSERTGCHTHRKTFIPTLVVKKPRAKNLSV